MVQAASDGQRQTPLMEEEGRFISSNGREPLPTEIENLQSSSSSEEEISVEEAEHPEQARHNCGLLLGRGARSLICAESCNPTQKSKEKLHIHHIPHGTDPTEPDSSDEAILAARRKTKRLASADPTAPRVNDRLNFINGQRFKGVMAGMIGLNALVLAAELDHPRWGGWVYMDNFFQVAFTFELVLREQHRGLRVFLSGQERGWNILDTVIVVVGAVELWIVPTVLSARGLGLPLLRMMRLLRLLRLIRAVRIVRRLAIFMEAIVQMLNPLFSILCTFFLGLGMVAVVLTHLIGRGEGLSQEMLEHPSYEALIQPKFCSVMTTFYTLFQIVTVDNWSPIAEPLIALDSSWRWFFIGFIAFASWTMISILTAVASENVIGAASDRAEKEREAAEMHQREFITFLRGFFHEADKDGNGLLDREEFQSIVEADRLQSKLDEMDIHVDKQDLYSTWDMLDVSGDGELTIDEFVEGLSCLQDGLSTKYVVNLDYSIRRVAVLIEGRLEKLGSHLEGWKHRNELMLQSLRRQHKTQQEQSVVLWVWRQWAASKFPDLIKPQVMAAGRRGIEEAQASRSQPMDSINSQTSLRAGVTISSSTRPRGRGRRRGSVSSLRSSPNSASMSEPITTYRPEALQELVEEGEGPI